MAEALRLHREQWELYLEEFVAKNVQGAAVQLTLRQRISVMRGDANNIIHQQEVRRALVAHYADFWRRYKDVLEKLR